MEKYLFTDGTNGMREVISQEELKTLIESSAQPEKTVFGFSAPMNGSAMPVSSKKSQLLLPGPVPAIIPVKSELLAQTFNRQTPVKKISNLYRRRA